MMFARTKRLTLRPGWPEDAPALSRAIGHETVVAKLARAPWPYALEDAETFLALPRGAAQPSFLICARERSEEHTSELQSLMRISYAVFCLKKKKKKHNTVQHEINRIRTNNI